MPPFIDNDGAWHSCRVNGRELVRALAEIERDGSYETKFIVPYRLPAGREPGDGLHSIIVRDRLDE